MENKNVKQHIQSKYGNWLDQSKIICKRNGLVGEAQDLLHEVLCEILSFSPQKLSELYEKMEKNYCALDCLIMHMLKLNASSPTAPYRNRYFKNLPPVDSNSDLNDLVVFGDASSRDIMKEVESILDHLDISEKKRSIFIFCILEGHKESEWPGPESTYKVSRTITYVSNLIRDFVRGK